MSIKEKLIGIKKSFLADDESKNIEENFQKNKELFLDLLKIAGSVGVFIGITYQAFNLVRYGNNLTLFSYSQVINDSFIFFILTFLSSLISSLAYIFLQTINEDEHLSTFKKVVAFLVITLIFGALYYSFLGSFFDLSSLKDDTASSILSVVYIICNTAICGLIIYFFVNNKEKHVLSKIKFVVVFVALFLFTNISFYILFYGNNYQITIKDKKNYDVVYMNDNYAIAKNDTTVNSRNNVKNENSKIDILFEDLNLVLIKINSPINMDAFKKKYKVIYSSNDLILIDIKTSVSNFLIINRKEIIDYQKIKKQ